MKKIKIYGLLNLKALFMFDNFNNNFENTINAAYKMSEDGAEGVVLLGKNFRTRRLISKYLKNRLDIPVVSFVNSEKQFAKVLEEKTVFSNSRLPGTIFTLRPTNSDFLRKKLSEAILIKNQDILRIFNTGKDFIPEYSALISFGLCNLKYKFLISEEVLSARKGAELYKKLS